MKILRSHEIDSDRWDQCILSHDQWSPFALSGYLDAISGGKWGGVVYDDYRGVIPFAYNRKYLIFEQVYQPFLTRDFAYVDRLTPEEIISGLELMKSCFRKGHLKLGSIPAETTTFGSSTTLINQVIDLNQSYEDISKRMHKDTRRRIRRAEEVELEISTHTDIDGFLAAYYKADYPKQKPITSLKDRFRAVLEYCKANNYLEILVIKNPTSTLVTSAILVTNNRIINLIGCSEESGREVNANYAKVDFLLRKYAESNRVFDFFGSNLPGVKQFNKQFGAEEEPYLFLSW